MHTTNAFGPQTASSCRICPATRPSSTPRAVSPSSHSMSCRTVPQHGGTHTPTLRSHDQYNTTIYGLSRYRGVKGNRRRVHERGRNGRAWVEDRPPCGFDWALERRRAPFPLPAAGAIRHPKETWPSHFPEANVFIPLDSTAAVSNTPTSKWIEVSLLAKRYHPAKNDASNRQTTPGRHAGGSNKRR